MLVTMYRERTEDSTMMYSRDLTEAEQTDFLQQTCKILSLFADGLASPELKIVAEINSIEVKSAWPSLSGNERDSKDEKNQPLTTRIAAWLAILREQIMVAEVPNVI